jgi:hypothetical protein
VFIKLIQGALFKQGLDKQNENSQSGGKKGKTQSHVPVLPLSSGFGMQFPLFLHGFC